MSRSIAVTVPHNPGAKAAKSGLPSELSSCGTTISTKWRNSMSRAICCASRCSCRGFSPPSRTSFRALSRR